MIEAVFADQKLVRDSGLTDSTSPSLTLPPGRGEVAIHYNALSFQAPEKNRFKYKLDDVDWNEVGASRVAHFYLTPGSYRFQVMACNNDGVWNPTAASLAFVLQPHYWQTWWFKLAGVVAAGLLLVAWYRYRMARLREIENLRVQIAADLHDDVGARLTKVAMVTEMVDGQTTEADRIKPQIRNISTTTREIIQAMDEIVWTINPKNDTLDNLANYIFHHAQDYFHNSGIRCRMDLPAQLPELPISTETRHNLFMAVKEAMNNVLKHAGATEVRISLALAEGGLTFIVADNGRGFHLNGEHRTGDGLINMQKRLAQIGGRLVLESEPGRGTNVKMEAKAK